MMAIVWLVVLVVGVVAVREAARPFAGFATVVMLIFGGSPKTFVRRTSAV